MTNTSLQIVRLEEDIETLKSTDVTGNQLVDIAERLGAVRNRLHYLEGVCKDVIDASNGASAGEKHREGSPGAG